MVTTGFVTTWLWTAVLAQSAPGAVAGRLVTGLGSVTVQRAGQAAGEVLAPGGEVREGDVIATGGKSSARLLMRDKGVIDLGPTTRFAVTQYQVDAKQRTRLASLRLFVGRLWAHVSKVTSPDANFTVETSNAVAGVRGTEFVVDVDEAGVTQVTVVEGSVTVSAGPSSEAALLGRLQRGTVAQEGGGVKVETVSQGDVDQMATSVRAAPGGAGPGNGVSGGEAQGAQDGAGDDQAGDGAKEAPSDDAGAAPAEEPGGTPPADSAPFIDLPAVEPGLGGDTTRVRGRAEVRD